MEKKSFLSTLLSEDGANSSKRFIGIIGFFVLSICLLIQQIFKLPAPADNLVSAVEYISIACILGTVVEKFKEVTFGKQKS
jgi:hypothetical protein